ncbi:MAG: NAD(P)H-dependent oxidoreductase subunit E [Peptostreptococcaceae bacterium]
MCDFISHNKNLFNQLDIFINSFEAPKDNLLQILHHAQGIFGYLPQEVQVYTATKLNISIDEVYNLVNFYSYFTTELKGEFKINICLGALCLKKGADKVILEFENQLEIKRGQTTENLKFSLDGSRCVGSCGLAPVVVINEKVYANVNPKDVALILKEYN